jgi:hypothetical protein
MDDPALQIHILIRYKKSLVNSYSYAAQDVSAAQAHLEAYKYNN